MRLQNKVAWVTGSGRGIGRAIALKMAEEGAKVVVSDIGLNNCENVVAEIGKQNGTAAALECDVSSKNAVENTVNRIIELYDKLDILVNNAGIVGFKPFLDISEDEWNKMIDINLKGQFLCAQAAIREMLKNKWGRVINIGSISHGDSTIAFPQISHYTSSKGGVSGLTAALAVEYGSQGINTNVICPGAIQTEMSKKTDEETLKQTIMRIPKGRMGKPEEIANVAAFLASEEAEYVNGASIVVDGGWITM
jgi:3-oxoacyl-[acyl-carrier protein] reductase